MNDITDLLDEESESAAIIINDAKRHRMAAEDESLEDIAYQAEMMGALLSEVLPTAGECCAGFMALLSGD